MESVNGVTRESVREEYNRYTGRKIVFIAGCLIVMFLAFGLSVTVGNRELGFFDVYDTLIKHIQGHWYEPYSTGWYDDSIVWNVRVPRAIFAIVAGAGLSIAGAAMQSVLKNPLADPYTVGISSGACFGVAVATVLGVTIHSGSIMDPTVFSAFVFSLIPMAAVMAIAPKERTSPATLILAGVAISYLFNSLTTIILSFTDAESLAAIYEWQLGTLKSITWDSVGLPTTLTIVGSALLIILAKKLNVLSLGDAQATALGVNVEALRVVLLLLTSLVVAAIVAYAGIIGFVGLIAPHIVRLLIDSDNRFVIPGAAMFGAAFLILCDTLDRWLFGMTEVPVGIIVSFIGAPIFLILILKQSRAMW